MNNLNQFLIENENNKELINFITENKINEQLFNDYYYVFEEYLSSCNLCKKRENINKCQQQVPGYRRKLFIKDNQITTVLTDCLHRINKLDQKEAIDKFLIRHYPDSLLSLSWTKDFKVVGKERLEITNYLQKLLKAKSYCQGLFLSGEPGSGKTFIFILIANKLIQQKHTVSFISWPQFISEIKSNFENGNENSKKIEQIKNSDFLFIDDLGSESITAWERDELLFPILDARDLSAKTTFINSSYDLNALSRNYRLKRDTNEEIKIKRLIERIKRLTVSINLTKQNLVLPD